jgi:hypothetical protein
VPLILIRDLELFLAGKYVEIAACNIKANYYTRHFRVSCSVDIMDREALGISNVVRKLILFFPPPLLVGMPMDILQSFLEQLTQLTCRFSEGAAQEESVSILNHRMELRKTS